MAVDANREVDLARQLLQELKSNVSVWSASGAEFVEWVSKVLAQIRRVYGNQSPQENDFNDVIDFRVRVSFVGQNYAHEREMKFRAMLPQAQAWMEAIVQDFEMRLPSAHKAPATAVQRMRPRGVAGIHCDVKMEQQKVVDELQRVASLLGKRTLSGREFDRHRGTFSSSVVERTFGSWNKAIRAAGLVPTTKYLGLPDDVLEAEFRRVQEKLGKIPTRSEFAAEANLSPGVYDRRFGRWSKSVEHYVGRPASAPVAKPTSVPPATLAKSNYTLTQTLPGLRGRRAFGPPTNFRELRHEPANEQGVVYVFGMVARDLGFLVEAIGTGYPDCAAKRRVKGGNYVQVDIEFEFKSSNLLEHGHDPSQCDLIVCWEHDWPECPLEVIELKKELQRLHPNV